MRAIMSPALPGWTGPVALSFWAEAMRSAARSTDSSKRSAVRRLPPVPMAEPSDCTSAEIL